MSRPAARVALLAAALAGCAVTTPPVRLGSGEAPQDAPRPELGVVPFRDLRPEEQREGRHPRLVPLLLWNQRIGEYVTGRSAFVDDPLRAATNGAALAFADGPFGSVGVLAATSEEVPLAEHCNTHGLRWLATGAVLDLYGTMYQRSYALLFPTPWSRGRSWDHDLTDPFGVATLRVEVYDCVSEERVFAQRFSVRRRCPDQTLSRAAKLALEEVLGELRTALAATGPPLAVPAAPGFQRIDPL